MESLGFECLYCYTIGSHIPGLRRVMRAIPLSALRMMLPFNLGGLTNVQLYRKNNQRSQEHSKRS